MSFTCIDDKDLERMRARLHELEQRLAEPGCGEACPVATKLKAERDEARAEVKRLAELADLRFGGLCAADAREARLREALRGLLLSRDAAWTGGHDWQEAVEAACAALGEGTP